MTDIHQWRRMIQTSRARTPAVETDESDGFLSPTTPRKGLKPKLSSYFTQQAASTVRTKPELPFDNDLFNQDSIPLCIDGPAPCPDAENLIDSVMSRLLAEPYKTLDPRFNCILLQIFECFRNMSDVKKQLQVDLEHEIERCSSLERGMQESARQWDREKQEYKAEVKRLELILARGENGLAEVTLARQDSLLHYKQMNQTETGSETTLETIFEFLERTKRYEDRLWSSQRATMKKMPTSPSVAMRRLSKTLATNLPMPNVYHDLPFGTPRNVSVLERTRRTIERSPASDGNAEMAQHVLDQSDPGLNVKPSEPRTSCSDDSHSTFSCVGDLLPDESADISLIKAAGTDSEFVAMKRIARVLAKRRHVDPNTIMPKLQQLFNVDLAEASVEKGRGWPLPNGDGDQLPRSASASAGRRFPENNLAKHPRLKTMASGFFSKKKPQLNINTSSTYGRRFSFEPGDDTDASLSAPALDNLPAAVKDRLLRKSMSLSFLSEAASSKEPLLRSSLSPVQQSPTASAPPSDPRKPSRIPTPVHGSRSLARPRQERENSASSLLTAIKHADEAFHRSDSVSSSAFSSPSGSRIDLTQDLHSAETIRSNGTRTASSNSLLEHTNALRGSALAAVAAVAAAPKPASTLGPNVDQGDPGVSSHSKYRKVHDSVNSCRPSMQSRVMLDMNEPRKENTRPMMLSENSVDHRSNATL